MNCQTAQTLLGAYADRELDLTNDRLVEMHLDTCTVCKPMLANIEAIGNATAGTNFYFNAPDSLKKNIAEAVTKSADRAAAPGASRFIWRLAPVFAGLAVVFILVFWLYRPGHSDDEMLVREVVSSHIRSMMAEHLTDVPSSDQHTVKPWFDGKLDFSPPVTDLAASGFPLIGGRLDYLGNRPVAALIYQRRQHLINLFVFPSNGDEDRANQMFARQGYNVVVWNRSGMCFWAVSDVNLNDLQEFAADLRE